MTRRLISELRKEAGLSQQELADRIGTTQVTLSGWENGHHVPRANHLQALSEVLGVPMGEIAFGGEVREVLTARVRSIIQAAVDSGDSAGVWRTDDAIYVRDRFKPVTNLFTGMRVPFLDYVNRVGELVSIPIGTPRRGVRQVPVWKLPLELPA